LIFLLEYENEVSSGPHPLAGVSAVGASQPVNRSQSQHAQSQHAKSSGAGERFNSQNHQKSALSRSQPNVAVKDANSTNVGVFDVALFNGVLSNTIRLLSSNIVGGGLIDALDRSAVAVHQQAILKASRARRKQEGAVSSDVQADVDIGEPYSLREVIETSAISKLQGLIVFNNSMLKSGKTIGEVLDSAQMEKVNRHILSNVLEEDITPMLRLLDEVKCRVTGDKKNSSRSKSTKIKFDIDGSGGGGGVSNVSEHKASKHKSQSRNDDANISLESLSAEFSEGELKLSSSASDPLLRGQGGQRRGQRGQGKSPNKDGGVGISKDLWNRLDSKDKINSGVDVGNDGSRQARNEIRSEDRSEKKSERKSDTESSNLWNNSEYRDKSTAVRMIVRVQRRLTRKMMQRSFHRWVVFMQATSTAANVVKQMIPFQSQQSMAEESVVSAYSENVTQSEEYLRLQEEREELAREKDAKESQLQEMTQQFDNMLRRNSMLQEQGMKTNVEMKTKLRVLK
jgi:hypothetical protein